MDAKEGSIEDARKVFDPLVERGIVSWTTMLKGAKETVQLFEETLSLEFNLMIYHSCVLTVCSHSHLLDEGQYYFHLMRK
ncbi:hypothetical protein ACLB2K_032203 [Fragaria x ananassa]